MGDTKEFSVERDASGKEIINVLEDKIERDLREHGGENMSELARRLATGTASETRVSIK